MALTKSHLVERIGKENDMDKTRAAKIIESLFEIIKKNLEEGEDVLVSGFGKFCVKEKSERRGRNPHTGEEIILPSRKVITFKVSHVLKEKINGS